MTARRVAATVLAALLLLAAGCRSTDVESGGVTIVVEGVDTASPRRLIDSAAREIEAFGANGLREA